MAISADAAFREFYERINFNGDNRATANTRRDSIIKLLGASFDIQEAYAFGSIPRFTALSSTSDVDIMVALHYAKHIEGRSPLEVLQAIQNALSGYRTGRKNGQAVTLYYERGPNVDIVPASQIMTNGVVTRYEIPDTATNTWIQTNPKTHASDIENRSAACGVNFRRLIKMVKHWNKVHSEFLQGYHIEVLALKSLSGNLDATAWCLFKFFDDARALLAGPLLHGFSFADAYLTPAARAEALKRWDKAIEQSRHAWLLADVHHDLPRAIDEWRSMFGKEFFPSFG